MTEKNFSQEGTKATLKLDGDLVAPIIQDLRKDMKQYLQQGITEMTLDLSNTNMVDSVGIGFLVAVHNSMQQEKGVFMVTQVSEEIYDLFHSMRLDRHFTISQRDLEGSEE